MNELLVPLSPAEFVDRLAGLRSKVDVAEKSDRRTELARQRDLLQRAADRVLPADDTLHKLSETLYRLHGELRVLKTDLQACEARSDFGPGFTALARAGLELLDEREQIRVEIGRLLDSHPEIVLDVADMPRDH